MSVLEKIKSRRLLVYNLRILLGNSYWLIITPIAAAEIVFFWSTATAGFSSAMGIARIIEMLAPILGAFLCAYAVAPEQAGVGELVFVRPVSPEKILLLRLAVIFGFVLSLFFFLLLVPLFLLYRSGMSELPLAPALLSALVSMIFLSALSLAVASATRQPMLGLAVAGGYWALDLIVGSGFNPLLTLHSFADFVAVKPLSELWWINKLLLFALAAVFYGWNRTLLGRPTAPRRVLVVARNTALIALVAFGYLWSGAAYKVGYGLKHEAELGNQTQLWYQQQFRSYGPLPVAWLFGPAFPLYAQAQQGRVAVSSDSPGLVSPVDVDRMRQVVEKYPKSMWADNARFELARSRGRRRAKEPYTVYTYREGAIDPDVLLFDTDQAGVAQEMEALAKAYPHSIFAPLALAHAASIHLALLEFPAAIERYQELLRTYPTSPQAAEAGLGLDALYARQGRWEDALRAGDIAAAAAGWDLRAQAYFGAAQAAERLGKSAEAKERYQKARAAAEVMRRRAGSRIHTGSTNLTPAEIILTAERIMNNSDKALAGKSPAALAVNAAPASATVEVRVTRQGRGVAGVRVALCEQPNRSGQASPFTGSFGMGATAADGSVELAAVTPGAYHVIGFAVPEVGRRWEVEGLHFPVQVSDGRQVLPAFVLTPERASERAAAAAAARRAESERLQASGRGQRGGAGGRGGGGGRRGGGRGSAAEPGAQRPGGPDHGSADGRHGGGGDGAGQGGRRPGGASRGDHGSPPSRGGR